MRLLKFHKNAKKSTKKCEPVESSKDHLQHGSLTRAGEKQLRRFDIFIQLRKKE